MTNRYTPTQVISCLFVDIIAIGILPAMPFWRIGFSLAYILLISVGILAIPNFRAIFRHINKANISRIVLALIVLIPLLSITLDWRNSIFWWIANLLMALFIILGVITALVYGIHRNKIGNTLVH
jgi:hypothetical protein